MKGNRHRSINTVLIRNSFEIIEMLSQYDEGWGHRTPAARTLLTSPHQKGSIGRSASPAPRVMFAIPFGFVNALNRDFKRHMIVINLIV